MCQREGASLQRGMNFRLRGKHSVLLMSVRPGAPYQDRLEEGGSVLIYEGHDHPRTDRVLDPKSVDQPETTPAGRPTQNALFLRAANEFRSGLQDPHVVRVYEKIQQGIWSYNGVFHLIDSWKESDGKRLVFKFKLIALPDDSARMDAVLGETKRRRIIPTEIKIEVWRRDGGKCRLCGATDELHFDHDLPYSLGGTSWKADNVQLLCARHNLSKGAKIL